MAFGKGKKKRRSQATLSNVPTLANNPEVALDLLADEVAREDDEQVRIKRDVYKMIDQGVGSIVDLWAPPRLKILSDNIEIGNECLSIFTISNWPTSLSYGWLNSILDDPSIADIKKDISLHIHPVRKDYAMDYMQDKFASARSSANAEYEKGKVKETNQRAYDKQMKTTTMIRDMLQSDNENMFQVSMVIGIYGEQQWALDDDGKEILVKDAKTDLIEKTRRVRKVLSENSSGGFSMKPLLQQQRDGIKSLLPLGYGGLHSFQNFYTSALATSFPFTQGSLQVDDGILYGTSVTSGQPIFFDIFNKAWMKSFNCIIVGTKGSGKSATAKTLLGRYMLKGTQIFIIDPAISGNGEYTNFCTACDGSMVDFGGANGIYINPFELVPPQKAPKSKKVYFAQATQIYKDKKKYLVGLFDIMREVYSAENGQNSKLEKFGSVLSLLIDRTYQYMRIDIGRSWNFKQWTPQAMPTLNVFYDIVSEYIKIVRTYDSREKVQAWGAQNLTAAGSLKNQHNSDARIMFGYYRYLRGKNSGIWREPELQVLLLLKNIISEYIMDSESTDSLSEKAHLFNGTKPADLSNQVIVFRFGKVDPKIQGLATYMCFELINSRIASSENVENTNKIVVLDEAWKLINSGESRKYLEALYREGRKTRTGTWLISQSYDDFQGDNKVFSEFAETKIIMAIPDSEISTLIDDIELSTTMADIINADRAQLPPGYGVLHLSGNRKETVSFYCDMSPLELAIADTTDSNKPPLTAADILGRDQAELLGLV